MTSLNNFSCEQAKLEVMSTEAMMAVEGGSFWSAVAEFFAGLVAGWNSNIPQTTSDGQ